MAALVAVGRLGRLQPRALARPIRFSHSETVESARPSTSAISAAVIRTRRSLSIASTRRCGSRVGLRRGREERSCRATRPRDSARPTCGRSARSRRRPRPPPRATSPARAHAGDQARLFGQVRALPWSFIRCPPWDWVASTPSASEEARMKRRRFQLHLERSALAARGPLSQPKAGARVRSIVENEHAANPSARTHVRRETSTFPPRPESGLHGREPGASPSAPAY